LRAVGDLLPGEEDPRKVFVLDDDIGVGLIVLQVDVEQGLELFDEGVLKQKSILFGVHYGKLYLPNPFYQFVGFETALGFIKIRTYAFTDMLCLAYIKQAAIDIIVFINAR
jgi:hypothetical protein